LLLFLLPLAWVAAADQDRLKAELAKMESDF
jgi:hypothetical protein